MRRAVDSDDQHVLIGTVDAEHHARDAVGSAGHVQDGIAVGDVGRQHQLREQHGLAEIAVLDLVGRFFFQQCCQAEQRSLTIGHEPRDHGREGLLGEILGNHRSVECTDHGISPSCKRLRVSGNESDGAAAYSVPPPMPSTRMRGKVVTATMALSAVALALMVTVPAVRLTPIT